MILISLSLGGLFGCVWGLLFSNRYRHLTTQAPPSLGFLASTSVIRYLLLAGLLVILMTKYHIDISWWLGGFLASFWTILLRKK